MERLKHMQLRTIGICMLILFLSQFEGTCQSITIDSAVHHIRNAGSREWLEFPERAEAPRYAVYFSSTPIDGPATIRIRQYDIKQDWSIELNNEKLGLLFIDEKDLYGYYAIPPGLLRRENNSLILECLSKVTDDIMIGQIELYHRSKEVLLSEAEIKFTIVDDNDNAIPGRITIVDENGVLQTIISSRNDTLAIRPGYAYTGSGKGNIKTMAGTYTLYATRGFEYSVDSLRLTLEAGKSVDHKFRLKHEVNTDGWVSSDTHLHTYTHSGHGDCTDVERAITVAGEGIEVPIMTDHNKHIDIAPLADKTGTRKYFTPIVGNEVTTRVGHFNVFPVSFTSAVVDPQAKGWNDLARRIKTPVIILNHGRDVHHSFIPFDEKRYLQSTGWRLDENDFFFNAMEVINSGSQQSDPMQLFHDWFGLLNRGHRVTPVGSSDSHDVSRFFAGQARTFVKSDDRDVSNIDLSNFVKNFTEGKVLVSLGLLVKITVNDRYGPGDLAPAADSIRVVAEVYGPAWSNAVRITLYANGRSIREAKVHSGKSAGLKGKFEWTLPRMSYDQNLVAIAEGQTGKNLFWPLAKPYQPASPAWTPRYMGATGAVWVDGDGNGKRTSAYDHAVALLKRSKNNIAKTMTQLSAYDAAVAAQVAALLKRDGVDLNSKEVESALRNANQEIQDAFAQVREALR